MTYQASPSGSRKYRSGPRKHLRKRSRRGSITVLSAVMMFIMIALLAFALDIGYLVTARTELQRTADASALAACWELVDEASLQGNPYMTEAISNTRSRVSEYAALNPVCGNAPAVDVNANNAIDGDVVVGYLADFANPTAMQLNDPSKFNAVQVRVQRAESLNGLVPFFFAGFLGVDGAAAQAEATAAIQRNIVGFRIPLGGGNVGILPFALDEESLNEMLAQNTSDDWAWDEANQQVVPGSDGIPEMDLYPHDTGSPGNRGTVDIGSNNNSTADIARQILDGVSSQDLQYHGGELKLDQNGELSLNADPGISAGFQDELTQIKGEPRSIPIFRELTANGNNAQYTIVKWLGVRILEVELTGNNKRVIIQPANVASEGVIPGATDGTSYFIYSRPVLVR